MLHSSVSYKRGTVHGLVSPSIYLDILQYLQNTSLQRKSEIYEPAFFNGGSNHRDPASREFLDFARVILIS